MSLDDVRAAIDRIDDRIVALLAQRQEQVRAAAAFKTDDASVRAPDRRAALLARVRGRAVEEGADPDVVAATYAAMVDAFIALELGEHRARGNPAWLDASTPARARSQEESMTQETVTSPDGTPIAYTRSGHGPPLVLVHGTSADHSRWAPVLPAFEQRYTVCAIDRRGRGGSGDAESYAIEREFEDVAAVVDSLGEPVTLLGQSHGALCALEACLRSSSVRALVLHEPPFEAAGSEINPPEVLERLETLLQAGDRDGVVATMAREVAGVPPEVVASTRSLPVWRARMATAHTIPRELRATKAYRFDPERFRKLAVPTLLLTGSESAPELRRATDAVDEALPDSRIVVMQGQGHVAMDTGSDLFTAEVLRFTEGS